MQAAGLDITYEEVEKLLELMQREQAANIAGKELREDDLQKVSGGTICMLGMSGQSCDKYLSSCDNYFKDYDVKEPCFANLWCDQLNVTRYDCFESVV